MTSKIFVSATLLALFVSPAFGAPVLTVIPQGVQAGNWVWEVDIAPDLVLSGPTGTPIAEEIGFRLTGDPLVSVANLNPLIFDTNNPGNVIFGWETSYGSPAKPEGIEANCTGCTITNPAILGGHAATVVSGTTNEIFTAMGSGVISTPGPTPFLKVIAKGPGTGGPLSSTMDWLGAYNGGKGRIAQIVGFNTQNFDIYSGSLTQSVPEPAGLALLTLGIVVITAASKRRGSAA